MANKPKKKNDSATAADPVDEIESPEPTELDSAESAAAEVSAAEPSEIAELKAQVAEMKAMLAHREAASTEPVVNGSPQPSPSDVTPGMVWRQEYTDQKGNTVPGKFVPYAPDPSTQFRFKIKSPNKTYNAEKGGVRFREGVGGTNDPDVARWFVDTLKYRVEPTPPAAEEIEES